MDKISSLGQPITDLQVRGLGLFPTNNEAADLVQLTSFKEDWLFKGSGCGSVDSDTRGPQLKSSNWQNLNWTFVYSKLYWKYEKNKKVKRKALFKWTKQNWQEKQSFLKTTQTHLELTLCLTTFFEVVYPFWKIFKVSKHSSFYMVFKKLDCTVLVIDTISNLVFWSRLANKLWPWHNVYIIWQ